MLCATEWVGAGSWRSLRPSVVVARVSIRPATMASIIKGLRKEGSVAARGGRKGSWGAKSSEDRYRSKASPKPDRRRWSRPSRHDRVMTSKALEGSTSERQRHKLRRKLDRKAAEEADQDLDGGGKQSRRKRFYDPDSSFGKKSLVYLMKGEGSAPGKLTRRETTFSRPDRATTQPKQESPETERQPRARTREAMPKEARPGSPRSVTGKPRGKTEDIVPQSDLVQLCSASSTFVYGRAAVMAALEHGRRKLYQLYVYQNRKLDKVDEAITEWARDRGVGINVVPLERRGLMDRMSAGRPHNGIILEASPLPQLPVESLGAVEESPGRLGFNVALGHQSKESKAIDGTDSFLPRRCFVTPRPFVLLLNMVLDPGNVGALLRTAHFFGVDAVGIAQRETSSLSPVALKAASGAAEELRLFSVGCAVRFLKRSRQTGWKTYAGVPPPSTRLLGLHGDKFMTSHALESQDPLRRSPCVLVIGGEGGGLSRSVRASVDYEVTIPKLFGSPTIDSLNVSVAGALLCHSFVRGSSAAKAGEAGVAAPGRRAGGVKAAGRESHVEAEAQTERMF